jgi:hypothetical protein
MLDLDGNGSYVELPPGFSKTSMRPPSRVGFCGGISARGRGSLISGKSGGDRCHGQQVSPNSQFPNHAIQTEDVILGPQMSWPRIDGFMSRRFPDRAEQNCIWMET